MAGPRAKRGSRSRGRSRGSARTPVRGPVPRRDGRPVPGHGRQVAELCELGPFSVFCALYLGLTADEGYAAPDRAEVARRFGLEGDELDRYLAEHGLTSAALRELDFDVASAQLDIRVAPNGVSRLELARTMFEDLRRQA